MFSNTYFQKTSFHRTIFLTFASFLVSYFPVSKPLLASDQVATQRAQEIWKLDDNIGISESQLIDICTFIDRLQSMKGKKERTFTQKQTGLPCVIKRLYSPKGFIIKDLPDSFSHVGRGAHKIVKKCIFYGPHPKIIASCSGDSTVTKELDVLRKLKGCRGITPFIGASRKTRGRYEIYLEYFSAGTLGSKLDANYRFTEKQVLKIAKDLALGIESLQKHYLVHRDLHEYNILLQATSGGLFEAAIADFGKAIDVRQSKRNYIPWVAQHIYPSELLLNSNYEKNIYTKDIYALGCSLYRMVWRTPLPWLNLYNKRVLDSRNRAKKVKIHKAVTGLYKKTKEDTIGHLLQKKRSRQPLTHYEQFQIIVFEMIDPNPHQRPKASQLVQRLNHLSSK